RVFRQGLEAVAGWVLPLSFDEGWRSSRWFFREERCFLMPGDSPIGFRLPLDSLPWATPEESIAGYAADPFAPRAPLRQVVRVPPEEPELAPSVAEAKGPGDARLSRTAVCVEPRQGTLHVFMPPLFDLDAYLELVAAVERAAHELGLPVQLEGYPPPEDPRLGSFRVTPDPGVIEVNIPPVQSWSELIAQTESLYASAREEKLADEKIAI